ncbi:MAG: 4-(cytidine 5'-diphospho)-2-C-methyl-D-erythritol kinase [Pseudoflavonifractor sp.]
MLELSAHGKLNLSLDVLGRRADGYHDLRMVMQSVVLSDAVRIQVGTGAPLRVSTNRSFLPNDERNLAAIAARRFADATGCDFGGISIHIQKEIPVCAGMGGGSSDAAAVICGLDELMETHLSAAALEEIGAAVGSDVPYCVRGGTTLALGRGELLRDLPTLPTCHAVLCKPNFPVSTPELFAAIDGVKLRHHPDTTGLCQALAAGDLPRVAQRMYNVFEAALPPRRREEVSAIKALLIAHGALGASMSGTGPTVFGLFADKVAAQSAYEELARSYRECFLTKTV